MLSYLVYRGLSESLDDNLCTIAIEALAGVAIPVADFPVQNSNDIK